MRFKELQQLNKYDNDTYREKIEAKCQEEIEKYRVISPDIAPANWKLVNKLTKLTNITNSNVLSVYWNYYIIFRDKLKNKFFAYCILEQIYIELTKRKVIKREPTIKTDYKKTVTMSEEELEARNQEIINRNKRAVEKYRDAMKLLRALEIKPKSKNKSDDEPDEIVSKKPRYVGLLDLEDRNFFIRNILTIDGTVCFKLIYLDYNGTLDAYGLKKRTEFLFDLFNTVFQPDDHSQIGIRNYEIEVEWILKSDKNKDTLEKQISQIYDNGEGGHGARQGKSSFSCPIRHKLTVLNK